jgi:hypothetical protein
VLSPASLTSELRTFNDNATCSVATLNFAQESTYDFRDMSKYSLKSLNFYNTTQPAAEEKRDLRDEGYFDYYDQPSKNARRLAFSSVYMQKPQPRENASSVFCGSGWNCTYPMDLTRLSPLLILHQMGALCILRTLTKAITGTKSRGSMGRLWVSSKANLFFGSDMRTCPCTNYIDTY